MQKAKGEDFRVEEELRIQKAKYEETSEEVYRRMQDVGQRLSLSQTDVTYRFFPDQRGRGRQYHGFEGIP